MLSEQKVREVFGSLAMDKQRLPSSGLTKMGLPSYVAEWVLEDITPGSGPLTEEEIRSLSRFAERMIPKRNEHNLYRNRLLTGDIVPVLAYLNVEVSITRAKQERTAQIPALGFRDCWISDAVVENNEALLKQGMWGIVDLLSSKEGVKVAGFAPMQATVDLKQYQDKRASFSDEEWRELMLSSCGYEPAAYNVRQQIWVLCRLLPLVQKGLHLMELAPKGTGKSYIYENISPKVYSTAGNITPAVLFYNNASEQPGLLARYDVVVLDEVQRIKLTHPEEIISNLKLYLANGRIRRGGKADIPSDCGLVLLANIPLDEHQQPASKLLVRELPEFLRETAFLDRFPGIIPGWEIPKFHQGCIASGVGLKADFFSDTLTALRHEVSYDEWVRQRIRFADGTSIRDQNAVISISSGLVKILYPNLNLSSEALNSYCLQPALRLRQLVRDQLWQLDEEYRQTDRQIAAIIAPNVNYPHATQA